MQKKRIAVLGTYRSGSSAIAGMLHYLSVDMGGPFWGNYFEPADLAQALRHWWSEPRLVASVVAGQRIALLGKWIEARERHSRIVGAKHPLLSLCAQDIVDAWGSGVQFVWCQRPIEESVESLRRAGWWARPDRIQRRLHESNVEFFRDHDHVSVDLETTRTDPRRQVQHLSESLGLEPSASQIADAVKWIEQWPSSGNAGDVASARTEGSSGTFPVNSQRDRDERLPGKIVATVLSGNSEAVIGEAVESIEPWVDEICLIDTGISDGTRERVADIAAGKLAMAEFPWCGDFAAARNKALAVAEERGATWVLTVDTDERLVFSGYEGRRELLEQLDSDPKVMAWMVSAKDGSYSKERFIRMPATGLQWRGRTHETLIGFGQFARKPLPKCHFWECAKPASEYQHKLRRDLAILLEETADRPLNPRWWYYLGQTYEGLKLYRKAVEAFDRCIRLDGWPDEAAWACYTAARCLVSLEEYREAEEYCGLGMTRKPSSPELPWLAGWCCFQRGALQEAVTWCNLAIVLGRSREVESTLGFRHPPAWHEAPYDVLRHVFRKLGSHQAANTAEQQFQAERAARLRQIAKA